MSRRILARLLLVNQMLHTSISIAVHNMLLYSITSVLRLLLVPFLYMGWCGVGGIAANFVADANQLSYSIASERQI